MERKEGENKKKGFFGLKKEEDEDGIEEVEGDEKDLF